MDVSDTKLPPPAAPPRWRKQTINGALLAVALFVAGLAGGPLKAQNGPAPAPTALALAPGPGMETVRTRCTACHPPAMMTDKHFTAQTWANVVDQMIDKGAQVNDADYAIILAYLTRNYGARPSP